jgi:ATP-binding cassette, subfamily B, multidrug efflux pump
MSGPTMRPGGNGSGPAGNGAGAGAPARGSGAFPGARPAPGTPPGPPGGMRRGPGQPGGMMSMLAGAAKPANFGKSFRRLVDRLAPERRLVALVIVMAVFSVAFAVVGPKILGNATNEIFNGVIGQAIGQNVPAGTTKGQIVAGLRARGQTQLADMLAAMDVVPGRGIDFSALAGILVLLIGIYLLSALFSWIQAYVMAGVTQRTVRRLRTDVDEKLGRLPLKYFDSHPRGDVLSRVTNDIDNIGQTLQQSLTQLITSLLTIVGVLVLMLTISWQLAVISILAVPASIVITLFIARRSQTRFVAQWASTGALNGHVEEMHTGHAIVKVFGRQQEAIETFDRENDKLYEASYQAQFISGTIQPAMTFVSNLNYVAIAVIGGLRVASGEMTLGDVIAFIQYSRQFTFPIIQTASIANVLQSAVASAERVFELLDEPEEIPDPVEPRRLPSTRGAVAFEDVSFRYEPDKPLIDDLSLVADARHTIAIVGPTGAGKTTLVNLLMRFYELDGGWITIDGIDTREMSRDDLRRTFGMVLQDTWLFHGTLRENIAYGRDGATQEEIDAAAEAAHVDHFVRTLPDGYNTVIDDDATNLSAGEKQLLTIARAFLANPAILILDEATSSVDTRTEVLIQKAMARLMNGRTAFVIAHRLSTIRDADTILVMNRGAIVEQGTHEELLANRGFYAELYNAQFTEALAEAV